MDLWALVASDLSCSNFQSHFSDLFCSINYLVFRNQRTHCRDQYSKIYNRVRSQPYPSQLQTTPNDVVSASFPMRRIHDAHVSHFFQPRPAAHMLSRPMQSGNITLQSDVHSTRRKFLHLLWDEVCIEILDFSPTLQSIRQSQFSADLQYRLLSKFADTTSSRYLSQVLEFFRCMHSLGYSLNSLQSHHALDILFVIHQSSSSSSLQNLGTSHIKALRWLVNLTNLTFPDLYEASFSTLLHQECEKKESLPLPLFLLYSWELDVCNANLDKSERLFKGTFLLCVWSSLRFSDVQHVKWSSIICDTTGLRAVSHRTKTCRSGMPFGTIWSGIVSGDSVYESWLFHWLILLDELWFKAKLEMGSQFIPDFLFAEVSADFALLEPMSYARALSTLRSFICNTMSTRFSAEQIRSYTPHSAKCTLLSWGSQLSASPEQRALQGHHIYHQSVQLYSRDDVFGAMQLQSAIAIQLRSGWRPVVPQHRGGQPPLQDLDIPTVLPSFFQASNYLFVCINIQLNEIIDVPQGPISEELPFDQASNAVVVSDSDSDAPDGPKSDSHVDVSAPSHSVLFIISKVAHVATTSDASEGPSYNGKIYRSQCGALCPASCSIKPHVPEGMRICLRKACINTFSHY